MVGSSANGVMITLGTPDRSDISDANFGIYCKSLGEAVADRWCFRSARATNRSCLQGGWDPTSVEWRSHRWAHNWHK